MPLKISVVMPTKNASAYLERAVRSFSSQSWAHRELVVVDGGSTDDTIESARGLLGSSDVLHVQGDRNATEAVIRGVGMSSGNIVGLLMADDWLEPGALEAVARAFEADPGVDLICGGARVWGVGSHGLEIEQIVDAAGGDVLGLDRLLGVPYMAAYFFRRPVWDRMNGFSQSYQYGADRDFLVRCRLAKLRARGINSFVYNYFRHEGSSTLVEHDDVVQAFLRDHRLMSTRWLKLAHMSDVDSAEIERWRRGETAALTDRQIKSGDYGKTVRMILSDATHRPRGALLIGRQLFAHLRRRNRSARQ